VPQDAVENTTAVTPGIEQGSCPCSFAAGSAAMCARNPAAYKNQKHVHVIIYIYI
jgi:hypothetical protein